MIFDSLKMLIRCSGFFAATGLFLANLSAGELHLLGGGQKTGQVASVRVKFDVGGELRVRAEEGKVAPIKMSVAAVAEYEERVTETAAAWDAPRRSLRHYDRLAATIQVGDAVLKPTLRSERNLVAVEFKAGATTLASPLGRLSREELDLLTLPANTLTLDRLLPDEEVGPGDAWVHEGGVLAELLTLDAVGSHNVESTFASVADGLARIEIAGAVHGAVQGVTTEIDIKGRYAVDLQARRVVWTSLALHEKRSLGHIGPGLDVNSVIEARLELLPEPKLLAASVLKKWAAAGSAPTALDYTASTLPLEFSHDRRWHLVSDEPGKAVLRLLDRGELLAQCNITAIDKPQGGDLVTLDNFRASVLKVLGERAAKTISVEELTHADGLEWFRVAVEGTHEKLPIRWFYHRVTDAEGRAVALVFALDAAFVERFGQADLDFVRGFRSRPATASR